MYDNEGENPAVKTAASIPELFRPEVVLVEPEIPQNTGNIARTCAALGVPLHLIGRLGFSLSDRCLKRAGVDYWHLVEVHKHRSLQEFFAAYPGAGLYLFTQKGDISYDAARYRGRVFLFFGPESSGLPDPLLSAHPGRLVRIPMQIGARSLNVSNAVAVALYEAYRQNGFPGLRP